MKAYIVRIDVDYDEHFVGFYSSYKKATDSIKSLRLIKDATYLENVENIKTGELKTFHLLELYTDKELSMYDIDKDNIYYPKYNESMNCWEWGDEYEDDLFAVADATIIEEELDAENILRWVR